MEVYKLKINNSTKTYCNIDDVDKGIAGSIDELQLGSKPLKIKLEIIDISNKKFAKLPENKGFQL